MNSNQRVTLAAQAGFTIVAVLLLVGVIATVSATYLRHVVIDQQQSIQTAGTQDTAEAVHGGLQFAKQSFVSGRSTISEVSVSTGKQTATLQVHDLANNRARCELQSLDSNGMGTTLLAEAARIPVGRSSYADPDELPRLWADSATRLLMDSSIPKHYVSGQTTWENTDVSGLVVIENTSALFLRDVIIRGAVVSEGVLVDTPFGDFDPLTTPALIMDGNTTIEAADFLPGVAVVMPDGLCSTWVNDARLRIEGDVVAHTVTISRPGTLRGNVANIAPLELHAELARPGYGREPREWAEDLDMRGTFEHDFLAFVPRFSTIPELEPIADFWEVIEDTGGTASGGTTTGGGTSGTLVYKKDNRSIYTGNSGASGHNSANKKANKKAKKKANKKAKKAAEDAAKAAEKAAKEAAKAAEDAAKEAAKLAEDAAKDAEKAAEEAAKAAEKAAKEATKAAEDAAKEAAKLAEDAAKDAEDAAKEAAKAAEKAAKEAAKADDDDDD